MALPPAQNLYRLLETDFCPLTLASCAAREFEAIAACDKSDNAKYLTALKDVAAFKILRQVCLVCVIHFENILMKQILGVASVFNGSFCFSRQNHSVL